MWSDNESALDLLGFQHLAEGVTALIENESLLPITIGVFGDWGSGKSTLLQMVKAELEKDETTLVLSFNGWLFEGYEDVKTALMGSILDAVTSNRKLDEKAISLASRLLRRVNWLRVAGVGAKYALAFAVGGPAGVGITAGGDAVAMAKEAAAKLAKEYTPEEAAKFLKDDPGQNLLRGIRDFRKDFAELLAETKIKRLVVMVDDLDRCSPDTIIETLEAIKLFLFVPHTAFVLGADERLVRYAVRRRFPELDQPGERIEVGRDYLEKLVQFPVRIPPLANAEIETYINLLFTSITQDLLPGLFEKARLAAVNSSAGALYGVNFNHGVAQQLFGTVPAGLAENLALAQRLAPVLTVGLSGNPRQCKRFLNTLLVRARMAKSREVDLKQTVLAKLMLVEYFKPEWFKRLAALQAAQEGKPAELAALESKARAKPGGDTEAEEDTVGKADGVAKKGDEPKKSPLPRVEIPPEFQTWLADPWMNDWLTSEPPLAGVDLRPYFFFSRDTLGPLGASVRRLSPAAQEALNHMLQESDAQRAVAIKNAGKLSPSDAAAVFEALVAQMERQEDLGDEKSLLWRAFSWAEARTELRGQLVTALARLPERSVPPAVPPRLAKFTQGTESEAHAKQLFGKWEKSSVNKPLSIAAKRQA
jgi:predicted KAP-like P-loop ATPase